MPSSPWIRDILGVYCPACGEPKLHLMQSDVIHCLAPGCPDPDAAHKILSDQETVDIVTFSGGHFNVLHPLRERISGALLECPVAEALAGTSVPGRHRPGRYRAWLDGDGKLILKRIEET
jgi:Family of unknown function (DUF6085)